MHPTRSIPQAGPLSVVASTGRRRRVLLVGPTRQAGSTLAAEGDLLIHARLPFLTAAFLAEVRPDLIVAPLIGPGWDVLDLAEALRQAGWRGALAIQSRPLPRAELVLDEVRALYPGIEVSLSDLPT